MELAPNWHKPIGINIFDSLGADESDVPVPAVDADKSASDSSANSGRSGMTMLACAEQKPANQTSVAQKRHRIGIRLALITTRPLDLLDFTDYASSEGQLQPHRGEFLYFFEPIAIDTNSLLSNRFRRANQDPYTSQTHIVTRLKRHQLLVSGSRKRQIVAALPALNGVAPINCLQMPLRRPNSSFYLFRPYAFRTCRMDRRPRTPAINRKNRS